MKAYFTRSLSNFFWYNFPKKVLQAYVELLTLAINEVCLQPHLARHKSSSKKMKNWKSWKNRILYIAAANISSFLEESKKLTNIHIYRTHDSRDEHIPNQQEMPHGIDQLLKKPLDPLKSLLARCLKITEKVSFNIAMLTFWVDKS